MKENFTEREKRKIIQNIKNIPYAAFPYSKEAEDLKNFLDSEMEKHNSRMAYAEERKNIELKNINEAYEYCRVENESIEHTKYDHEYMGYDDKEYPARATLIVENDGNYYVTQYEYFDGENWVDTGDSSRWSDAEINDTFFPYVPGMQRGEE